MRGNKFLQRNKLELFIFILIYVALFANAYIMKDSWIALVSAFCGITYTIFAGKGYPICYPIGVAGSGFYAYLSFFNHLWGNFILYACYYIPMQIFGFFQWNKNLKPTQGNKSLKEITKTKLNNKQRLIYFLSALIISVILMFILAYFGDKNPIIDSVTTVFSILGMCFTVKRAIEQWIAWFIVNSLSLFMWLNIVLHGKNVYSTVVMWAVYTGLSVYFYVLWHKEVYNPSSNKEQP